MKKHYDICLSGFWYGSNYGSLLSGFAAYRIFKDYGKEVLMLQKPGAASDDPEIIGGHNTKFIKKYYDPEDISPALSYESLRSLNEICDCFCAGPDQIWNYGLSFHENMFLPFAAEGKKLISFSASFGHKEDRTPPEAKERIKGYLNRYSAVSVSEQFCVDILKNNYGIDAVRLADPVFCLNKQYYDIIAEGSYIKETEPYILAYILDPSAQKRDAISYYARKAGIKAVNILDGNESAWLKNKKILNLPNTVPDAGAEEFLYLIKNAEFVITDSFHGTMFSMLFNKPFLALGNHARGYERFEELLGRFGLKDRLAPDPDNILQNEKYLEPIDYTEVNRIADEEKAKTLEWIKRAANIPEDKQPAPAQLWEKQMQENSEKEKETAVSEKTAGKKTVEKTAKKATPAEEEALPQPKEEKKDEQTGMREHYDVCIAGFWYGLNYGSLLNGYSMYRILKDYGKDVLMLQKPNAEPDDAEITGGHNTRFVRKYYDSMDISPALPYDQLKKLNDICDCFCAGSDQIWNYTLSFHENMYLPFAEEGKKLISFSTSFGHRNDKTPSQAKERVGGYLRRFSAVSVRERFDVDILRENYGIKATLLFEPVFCLDKKYFDELADNSRLSEKEPYMLTYILDPTTQKREAIKFYSEKAGLKLINILDGSEARWQRNNERLGLPNSVPDVGAEEFLNLFRGAQYVITDSFHGCAFSVIFNKPFLAIGNYGRGFERFTDLLGRLKLTDRLVSDPDKIPHDEKYLSPIDYTQTNEIIKREKERTVNWVKEAVDRPKEKLPSVLLPDKTVSAKLDKNSCTGCGACVSACPAAAVALKPDEYGYYRSDIDFDKCINCGKCMKVCPAIKLPGRTNSSSPDCYAFIARDEELLFKSSSGAIFPLLAEKVIDEGGVAAGAAWTDDFTVEHILVENSDDLEKLKKSKYLQSYMGDIDKRIKAELDKGRKVLFSGCPCQVAGLKKYLGREYPNLILVDLLCGNSPSTKFFKAYLEESFPQGVKDYQFRYKKQGWNWDCLTLTLTDGTKIERRGGGQDFYQKAYHPHLMCPPHCEKCIYQQIPRFGDITIGDFWGYTKKDPATDTKKGVSAVLCNNDKGREFFETVPEEKISVKKRVPLEWLEGNGYALPGTHNWRNPARDEFYRLIKTHSFSESVNLALTPKAEERKPIRGFSPLQYDSFTGGFNFDSEFWEEHFIDGKLTLLTKKEKSEAGHFAFMKFRESLKKDQKYRLKIRFKANTASKKINLHIVDSRSPKEKFQIVKSCINENGFNNAWVEEEAVFTAKNEYYNGFGIGALQFSGPNAYFMVDYVAITEEK